MGKIEEKNVMIFNNCKTNSFQQKLAVKRKISIVKIFLTNEMMKTLSDRNKAQFEAESILSGSRKVKDGDYAVLEVMNEAEPSVLFENESTDSEIPERALSNAPLAESYPCDKVLLIFDIIPVF